MPLLLLTLFALLLSACASLDEGPAAPADPEPPVTVDPADVVVLPAEG
jgi:hypothetical protein